MSVGRFCRETPSGTRLLGYEDLSSTLRYETEGESGPKLLCGSDPDASSDSDSDFVSGSGSGDSGRYSSELSRRELG